MFRIPTLQIHVWYIYLHENFRNQPNAGKYTSPMDLVGYIYRICFQNLYAMVPNRRLNVYCSKVEKMIRRC